MQPDLSAWLEAAHHRVGVEVAGEERRLEEHEAGGPDRGRAAEPRKDFLGDDRLYQEQQEGTDEDGEGKKEHAVAGKKCPESARTGAMAERPHSTGALAGAVASAVRPTVR